MSLAEMRMFRWVSRVTSDNTIRNEYIRESVGVVSIMDKMRENRFRLVML